MTSRVAALLLLAVSTATTVATAQTTATNSTCVSSLSIEGDDAEELRTLLRNRQLLEGETTACERAQITLRRVEAGWSVALAQAGDRVEREVRSLDDAAAWVESWLVPMEAPEPAPRPAPKVSEVNPPARDAKLEEELRELDALPNEPASPSTVVGSLGALVSVGFADDETDWSGGELRGQLTLNDQIWFGASVGVLGDPILLAGDDSESGEDVTRSQLRAAIRMGGRLRLSPAAHFDLGVGGGIASARVSWEPDEGSDYADTEGAAFAELLATYEHRLTPRWSLLVGAALGAVIALEAEEGNDPDDAFEPDLPPAHPRFLGSIGLGVGYSFSEAP